MHHLIINEKHMKGKKLKKINLVKKALDGAGISYDLHLTQYKGHATEIVKELTSDGGKNVIVACGGDGTLHEILNGFVDFENNSLALIPIGTGNDFAAGAGIPDNTRKAVDVIINGAPRPVDYIQLSSGLRSINAVGMGIDVDILKRVYSGTNAKKSKYLNSLIVCLAKFKSYDFTVEYDGKQSSHHGLIAALGNGKQFGGGIKLFNGAKVDDGYLNLVIADFISKPKIVGAFAKLMAGKPEKIKQITVAKVKAAAFTYHGDSFAIQADGELYENMPLDAHIESGKLKFYLPQK